MLPQFDTHLINMAVLTQGLSSRQLSIITTDGSTGSVCTLPQQHSVSCCRKWPQRTLLNAVRKSALALGGLVPLSSVCLAAVNHPTGCLQGIPVNAAFLTLSTTLEYQLLGKVAEGPVTHLNV